jgi:hypothetical protein
MGHGLLGWNLKPNITSVARLLGTPHAEFGAAIADQRNEECRRHPALSDDRLRVAFVSNGVVSAREPTRYWLTRAVAV